MPNNDPPLEGRMAIPSLFTIETPREDGFPCDPLWRPHFRLPGVAHLEQQRSAAEATKGACDYLMYESMKLEYEGELLIYGDGVE